MSEESQVDVWDVVDKGKKRIKLDGLKLTESNNGDASNGLDACLDAEFLDVYQGRVGGVQENYLAIGGGCVVHELGWVNIWGVPYCWTINVNPPWSRTPTSTM